MTTATDAVLSEVEGEPEALLSQKSPNPISRLPFSGKSLIQELLIEVYTLRIDRFGIRTVRQVKDICQVSRGFIVMVCADNDVGVFTQHTFDKARGFVTFRCSAFRSIYQMQTKFLTCQDSVTTIHNHPQSIRGIEGSGTEGSVLGSQY